MAEHLTQAESAATGRSKDPGVRSIYVDGFSRTGILITSFILVTGSPGEALVPSATLLKTRYQAMTTAETWTQILLVHLARHREGHIPHQKQKIEGADSPSAQAVEIAVLALPLLSINRNQAVYWKFCTKKALFPDCGRTFDERGTLVGVFAAAVRFVALRTVSC